MELSRNLRIDSVSRLHPTPPRQVPPEAAVADAVELMRSENVGCLLVVADGRLVGIFTEYDLLCRVLGRQRPLTIPVSACMTADPVVVAQKDSIRTAIRRMQEGGYRHLPVVDEAGRPVGILSVKRIVHYLVEHFPATIYNLPPDPTAVPRTREGA